MAKTAFIVGAAGQDGTLLAQFLRERGDRLLLLERERTHGENLEWNTPVDITRIGDVAPLVRQLRPDEIYHLAAIHHSSQEKAVEDLASYRASYEVNFFSLLNFLEAIRLHSAHTRLFYAASSHVFGDNPGQPGTGLQTETTPLSPQSVYAMTKVDGLLACRHYRRLHGVFASVGILYNHESPLRSDQFLTRKVIRAVAEIKHGKRENLVLGDIGAEVDWGYAPDYVEAMSAILGAEAADEFIVATGVRHSVRDFVATAFGEVGLDWTRYVKENPLVMERRPQSRIGDPSKLTRATGWKPRRDFVSMIRILLEDEMLRQR